MAWRSSRDASASHLSHPAEVASPPDAVVEARGLSFTYPDGSAALHEISLSVRPGEAVGLLGPNGSGKSTLLRLLSQGADTVRFASPVASERGRLLVVDQPVFREWLTGPENAEVLLQLRGLPVAESAARAEAALAAFGLGDTGEKPVASFSRGMRRRLALAVAFAARPRLLLLDEPQTGLDPSGRLALREAVGSFLAEGGAVVVSTHDAEMAAAVCDRVAFLSEGMCRAVDTPEALLTMLGARARIEFSFQGDERPTAGALGPAPASIADVTVQGSRLVLEVRDARSVLAEAVAWVLASGAAVASIEIREPTLEDAYFAVTGRRLEVGE